MDIGAAFFSVGIIKSLFGVRWVLDCFVKTVVACKDTRLVRVLQKMRESQTCG